jgi:hypothetical protein
MPGKSIGLPASECNVGSKLRKVPGSVCEDCYAHKGMYGFQCVQDAQYARLDKIDLPEWVPAMVRMIGTDEVFRWHDSGDLQDLDHLEKIMQVVDATPGTLHWLPTKEKGLLHKFIAKHGKRSISKRRNLVIRLSAAMRDSAPPSTKGLAGVRTSTVHDELRPHGRVCIAPKQDGECRDCRACWSRNVANISYHRH